MHLLKEIKIAFDKNMLYYCTTIRKECPPPLFSTGEPDE